MSKSQLEITTKAALLPYDPETPEQSIEQSNAVETSRSRPKNCLVPRDISPLRSFLQTPWNEASAKPRRYYVKKASETTVASLNVIAGEDSEKLWNTVVSSRAINVHFASESNEGKGVDSALLESLAKCCSNATQWDTRRRRQILSIMVDKVSFNSPQRYIPNLTPQRFKIAKQHLLMHGRGSHLPKPVQKRMCSPLEIVDHLVGLITKQHVVRDFPSEDKKLRLSSGEVLMVPNAIRNLVP